MPSKLSPQSLHQADGTGGLRARSTPVATPPTSPAPPSSPQPTDPLLPAARDRKERAGPTQTHPLLTFDELPPWMSEFESEYTLEGYRRPLGNWAACWYSTVGYLHNETVNIHTHLLSALYPLALLLAHHLHPAALLPTAYPSLQWQDSAVLSIFLAAAVICLSMSATYHTLSCHSKRVANTWNHLDYIGIVVLIVGSNYPAIYYGFFCDQKLQWIYTSVISVLGAMTAFVVLHPTYTTGPYRWARTLLFLSLGLSAVVPVSHNLSVYGWERAKQEMGLAYLFASGALYVGGALLYAIRFPERAFPRTFDYFGSSHQIFHVCVVAAAYLHFKCVTTAVAYHHGIMGGMCRGDEI